ncbi:hypothetical protein JCM8115_005212 [Rhodotorula mucilaginosa]
MAAYVPLPTSATGSPTPPNQPQSSQAPSSFRTSRLFAALHARTPAAMHPLIDQLERLLSRPRIARFVAFGAGALVLLALLGLAGVHFPSLAGYSGGWASGSAGDRARGKWGSSGGLHSWEDVKGNAGLAEPVLEVDTRTGYTMPPEVYPAALNPFKRANAAFVALVRNSEREAMRDSMRSVEARFNKKFGYPWVFLNDEPFDEAFKLGVRKMTRSEVIFAQIPKKYWGYPSWINQTHAAEERQKMVDEGVIYGGSESYRHMCRFNSGFFFEQEVLEKYKWYWRVEPGVEYFCDIDYDPFLFMEANNKVYGFTIVLYEYLRTVETLWDATREFARLHPEYIDPNNAIHFLVDDKNKGLQDGDWNLCHFWSNFEIGSLDFWRSKEYREYFKFLDEKGGFFYERWGDAPVHSFAAALFLPQEKIHNFYDISYRHNPYQTCPQNRKLFHDNGKCECYPENSFDTDGYSCMRQWWRIAGNPHEL